MASPDSPPDPSVILGEYDRSCQDYHALIEDASRIITALLDEEGIRVHVISKGLKERESLQRKLLREDARYRALADVTDVARMRIITYFADDVDRVATVIEREFDIDTENSTDKRASIDPDRFGYLSLHYVAKHCARRSELRENRAFSNFKFEIQIRSLVQHAWAEMEHDLGYKSQQAIPRPLRRRFARLAGLLEIADDEFCGLRDELAKYTSELGNRIAAEPDSVSIDRDSLVSLIQSEPLVTQLDSAMAEVLGGAVKDTLLESGTLASIASDLPDVGINSIGALRQSLAAAAPALAAFFKVWVGETDRNTVSRGASISILRLVLAAAVAGDALLDFFDDHSWFGPEQRKDLAARSIAAWHAIHPEAS